VRKSAVFLGRTLILGFLLRRIRRFSESPGVLDSRGSLRSSLTAFTVVLTSPCFVDPAAPFDFPALLPAVSSATVGL
jgi:hypothetical protein